MNVEIGTEAALFPEKEYISGIFLAVRWTSTADLCRQGRNFATTNGLPQGWVEVHHRCWVDSEEREGCFFSCVGAALQQRFSPSSQGQPLAVFSKKLEPAQIRYSACCAGICFPVHAGGAYGPYVFRRFCRNRKQSFFIFIALPIIYFWRWILFFILKTTKKDKQSVSIT